MKKAGGFLLLNYRLIFLAAIVIVASISLHGLNPWQNIVNVLTLQAPFIMIYAFGMTMVMLTGGLDLSQGSVAAFSTCIGGLLIIQGQIALGIAVTLAIGAGFGLLNGFLVTKTKVPPFIATYGTDWVARGLAFIVMGGLIIYGFDAGFLNVARGSLMGISNAFYIAVAVFIALFFLLQKTTFGRNVYMIGSNAQAARLTGVSTATVTSLVYTMSGLLAAIAGLLYVSKLDAAEPFLGQNFGITALAATLIGGTSLAGGKGGVGNTVIGVLIMSFLTNALNVWKVSVLWQDAVFGIVIVISALLEKARTVYVLKQLR